MGRVSGLVRSFVLFAWAILAACSPALKSFPLPSDVRLVAPDPELPHEISAFSGAWTGTWLEPPWGAIGDTALVVERVGREDAIVIYAWADNRSGRYVEGWVRRKARVEQGPSIKWKVDNREFVFQMGTDLNSIEGTMRVGSRGGPFIRMHRAPFEAFETIGKEVAANVPGPADVNISPPSPDLAPELSAFSGTWEGVWGGGRPARLIVYRISSESAWVQYAWADSPDGRSRGGWERRVADVLPDGKLVWGSEPKLTFHMAKDGMSIEGKWEKGGMIDLVIMKKVGP